MVTNFACKIEKQWFLLVMHECTLHVISMLYWTNDYNLHVHVLEGHWFESWFDPEQNMYLLSKTY